MSPSTVNITSEVWIFVNEANFEWHQTIKNAKNSYILGTFFYSEKSPCQKKRTICSAVSSTVENMDSLSDVL